MREKYRLADGDDDNGRVELSFHGLCNIYIYIIILRSVYAVNIIPSRVYTIYTVRTGRGVKESAAAAGCAYKPCRV